MAGNQYLDKTGVAFLWARMKQYVYDCCCSQKVTYTLEKEGSTLILQGSDGSKSVVTLETTTTNNTSVR